MSIKTKRFISIMMVFSLVLGLTGCVFESKELKHIKSVATSYSCTREDCELLNEKKNDKEVQRWLDDMAKKINKGEFSEVEVSAFLSYLERADVKHPEVEKQTRSFYVDIMKEKRKVGKVFSDSDPMPLIEYAEEVKKMKDKVSAEDIEACLPYDELAQYIRNNFTLTVSKSGASGYYDEIEDDYSNEYVMEEGSVSELTLKQSKFYHFEFFGDYKFRGFKKEIYRHTNEEWEEEILKPLDYESHTIYYKDVEVYLGEEDFKLLPESEVYVYPDGESYIVFIIQKNRILVRGKNKGFDMEYASK